MNYFSLPITLISRISNIYIKKNYLTTIIGCITVIILFLASLHTALNLKMDTEPTYWVYDAVPPALSNVKYGHDRYKSLNFVHDYFFLNLKNNHAEHINKIIDQIIIEYPKLINNDDKIVNQADDKGIVILTELSFRIFGYKVEGVMYLYYLLLGLSCSIFIYIYYLNPYAFLTIGIFLYLHKMILPLIKFNSQLGGVTALRCMPVLSMIALIHGIFFLCQKRVSNKEILAIAAQMSLLIFVLHIRSTTMWQLAALIILCLIFLCFQMHLFTQKNIHYFKSKTLLERYKTVIFLLAIITALLLALNLHRIYGFPQEYHQNGEIITRPFWHNIYSGFAFNPNLAEKYNLKIDDFSIFFATKQYLIENNKSDVWQATGGDSPNFTEMHWQIYDDAVKDMTLQRCQQYVTECLTTFFIYKPASMFKELFWITGLIKSPPDLELFVSKFPEVGSVVKDQFIETSRLLDLNNKHGQYWLNNMLIMVIICMSFGWFHPKRKLMKPALISAVSLAIGSMAPSIIGYPAPHTMVEAAISFPLFILILSSWFTFKIRLYLTENPKKLKFFFKEYY